MKRKQEKFTQLDVIKLVRRPLPKPTKVMTSRKDKKRKWNWRDELDEDPVDFSLPWKKRDIGEEKYNDVFKKYND